MIEELPETPLFRCFSPKTSFSQFNTHFMMASKSNIRNGKGIRPSNEANEQHSDKTITIPIIEPL